MVVQIASAVIWAMRLQQTSKRCRLVPLPRCNICGFLLYNTKMACKLPYYKHTAGSIGSHFLYNLYRYQWAKSSMFFLLHQLSLQAKNHDVPLLLANFNQVYSRTCNGRRGNRLHSLKSIWKCINQIAAEATGRKINGSMSTKCRQIEGVVKEQKITVQYKHCLCFQYNLKESNIANWEVKKKREATKHFWEYNGQTVIRRLHAFR